MPQTQVTITATLRVKSQRVENDGQYHYHLVERCELSSRFAHTLPTENKGASIYELLIRFPKDQDREVFTALIRKHRRLQRWFVTMANQIELLFVLRQVNSSKESLIKQSNCMVRTLGDYGVSLLVVDAVSPDESYSKERELNGTTWRSCVMESRQMRRIRQASIHVSAYAAVMTLMSVGVLSVLYSGAVNTGLSSKEVIILAAVLITSSACLGIASAVCLSVWGGKKISAKRFFRRLQDKIDQAQKDQYESRCNNGIAKS